MVSVKIMEFVDYYKHGFSGHEHLVLLGQMNQMMSMSKRGISLDQED